MIIRNDDISPSTDLNALYDMYYCIGELFPDVSIVSGVTLFGVLNGKGSVYPNLPLKTKSNRYLYNATDFIAKDIIIPCEIASHGLFHVKHGELHRDAQEMSIVGSCNFLKTRKFIAPFNNYNQDTVEVCREHRIELLTTSFRWRSMEHNEFDSSHEAWYFHSWMWDPKKLRKYLNADIASVNC